jgi:kynureninase
MNAPPSTQDRIAAALAPIGEGPLTAAGIRSHVAPLFSRALARDASRIYLANHSLGRPLDAVEDDVREALAAWYGSMGEAWVAWEAEMRAYRTRLAALLGTPRPDAVVPKSSAGQGLRAVLNALDGRPRVVATSGEFDSLDVILRAFAHRGRIELAVVAARDDGHFEADDIVAAMGARVDLVVVSQVMFQTGQRLDGLDRIVDAAHAAGGRVLLDVYHSLGALPVDVVASGVDFAVGGAYKYLRGGPGACFLYVAPRHLDAGLATLDTGWFAKAERFAYGRPDPPRFAPGGDAWLESTPPVLPFYQARAGQLFTLAAGVARLRAYSLAQQRVLVEALAARGIVAEGGTADRGAFVVVRRDDAARLAAHIKSAGIDADARGSWLRLCPDVLTTSDEIVLAAEALARAAA